MLPSSDQNRTVLLADSLRTVAGVVLLSALGLAPLNYGSTRLMPFETLIALTATGGLAWLVAQTLAGAGALPPRVLCAGVLLVAVSAVAWLWALHPPEWPAFTRQHYARVFARWPYSVVPRNFSLLLAWAGSATLSLVALQDLARDPAWRRAVAIVLLAAGAAVALLGLVQNATRARGIYWGDSHRLPGAFFGTFFHHTSAGAYLNSVWPLGIGVALASLRHGLRTPRALLLVSTALGAAGLVIAAHGGHVSRFPQVAALAAFVALALWFGLWQRLGVVRGLRTAVVGGAVGFAVLVAALGATRLETIRMRWQQLATPPAAVSAAQPLPESEWPRAMRDDLFIPSDHRAYWLGDRGAADAVALAAIAERPWFGWGPGGWTAAAAANSHDAFLRTFYLYLQFAHNDYLQAVVEWGLLGALGWALLIPGAALHAARLLGTDPGRDFLGAAAVVALAAVLAQSLLDFPLQIPAVQFNAVALAALAWSVPLAPRRLPSVP